jgi:predicted permease
MNREQRKQIPEIYQQVCDRLQRIPGVVGVTNSQWPMLTRDLAMPYIWVPGRMKESGENPVLFEQGIWPTFFDTMGMPIIMGRNLTMNDSRDWRGSGSFHAVINETLARKYFPGINPIGQKFGMTKNPVTTFVQDRDLIEIIGVVRDSKFTNLRDDIPPTAFLPFQSGEVTFEVRTAGNPLLLITAIREAVTQVNPHLLPLQFRSQSDQAELTYSQERHFAFLSSLFGLLALVLVCIGLFGLLSYNVTNRTQEIGVRMALGAQRSEIVTMIMRETLWLISIGIIIGLAASFLATRWIESLLYGVSRTDPISIFIAIISMVLVATVAGFLPARRATKVDPMIALRYE